MTVHPTPLRVEKHRHSRFWAVRDHCGALVVVAAYRTGAENIARLLAAPAPTRADLRTGEPKAGKD